MKHALLAIAAILTISPAIAEESSGPLTEQNIRDYYTGIPAIFQLPYPEFLKSYLARASDTLQVTTTTSIRMLDNSVVRSKHSMDKEQMQDMAGKAYAAASGAKLANYVTAIDIDPSGKSALVHETATIKNMQLPGADPVHAYIADSTETCIDTLVFTPGIGVQTTRSNCNANVIVTQQSLENQ